MKKVKCLLISLLMILTGCSSKGLKNYQGKWFDVNSSATLTFKGNKVVVTFNDQWKESYSVSLKKEYDNYVIDTKEGGLGIISALRVSGDGSLIGYEMILDAAGHTYQFVREEQLEKMKEIQDLSEDLPKEISSEVIVDFSLTFSTNYGHLYDLDSSFANAFYNWEIELKDNVYHCKYQQEYDSYLGAQYHGEVSEEFVKQLAELIKQENIAANNGYYHKNEERCGSYSLYVTYQSNEKIEIRAQGRAAETCVFKLKPLMDHLYSIVETND